MRTTEITKDGLLVVTETAAAQKIDNTDFIGITTRTIQANQLERHYSMIDADLNASQKTKVTQVIAAQKAEEGVKGD